MQVNIIPRLLQRPDRSFFLFGPRGTGKSTWLQQVLPDSLRLDNYRESYSYQEVELDEYLPAKTIGDSGTCPNFAKGTVIENAFADEPLALLWGWPGRFGFPGERDLDTPLTLQDYSVDPLPSTSESPFDELDENLTDEEIKKLIEYVREELTVHFAHELADKLTFLHEAVTEETDEIPISIESWRKFINFLRDKTNWKCPSVSLTPSNEIRAQWRMASNRHFAVVFLPTGDARYVVFAPNPKHPEKTDRLSGITSLDSLLEVIEPYRVVEWACQ